MTMTATILQALLGRQLLVVLDNCEYLLELVEQIRIDCPVFPAGGPCSDFCSLR